MDVPTEPQALAKSMSSAGDVVGALRRHDWTTLDAVARAADAGDESAQKPVAGVRRAAHAEELHSPLQPALAAAHQAATQWLLNQRVEPPVPQPGPTPPGPTPPGPTSPGQPPPIIDPDEVTLDMVAEGLDDGMLTLAEEIGRALAKHPGKKVRITWRLE